MPTVALPKGETASFPDGMAPADIEGVLRAQFPRPPAPDNLPPFVGAVRDTFGLTDRPGKRTMLDVIARPEGILEHAASLAVTAPTIALGGAGAGAIAGRMGLPMLTKLAPLAGRVATSGGLGAGKAEMRGDDPFWGGVIDAAVGAGGEGVAGALRLGRIPFTSLGLKDLGAPARGYEWASRAPKEALDLIRDRLPGIRFVVPSLGSAKLTPEQAVARLGKLSGPEYVMARSELADAFTRMEKVMREASGAARPLGMAPGAIFKTFTAKERFAPGAGAKIAEGARQGLGSNTTRAGIDATLEEPVEGIPLGAWGLGALAESTGLGDIARRVVR